METAKHFGSKLRKTLAALLATMALMAVLLPGALAVDLNVDVGFYFKQSRGGTCTLASAAMMLRRRAYLDGMDSWVDVTENGIKSTAWSGGLSHSFTYNDMHVGYATLPSGKAAKTGALVSILAEHPEGIVLYDRTRPHAVLLTGLHRRRVLLFRSFQRGCLRPCAAVCRQHLHWRRVLLLVHHRGWQ